MPQLYVVGFIALLFGIGIVVLIFGGRQRCPKCDASLPRSAPQCPHCGQVLGLAVTPSQIVGPFRYCPECKGEFRHDILTCPNCEVPLQDQPPAGTAPPEEPLNRGDLKTLCPATTPEEAEFLIEVLAEQEIPAVLIEARKKYDYERYAYVNPPLLSIGAGDIMVGETDLPRAKQILAELEKDSEILPEDSECGEDDAGIVCDECGAEVGPEDKKCPKCGAEFEEE